MKIKPFGLLGDFFVLRSVIATAQPEVIAPQKKIAKLGREAEKFGYSLEMNSA
jgi:hypothetical protein